MKLEAGKYYRDPSSNFVISYPCDMIAKRFENIPPEPKPKPRSWTYWVAMIEPEMLAIDVPRLVALLHEYEAASDFGPRIIPGTLQEITLTEEL